MEQKKELLASRIAKIQDPVQKRLLQDVLVDVFGELLTYSEESFTKLMGKEAIRILIIIYIPVSVKKMAWIVPAAVYLRSIEKQTMHQDIWEPCFWHVIMCRS